MAEQDYVITLFDKNQPVYNPGAIGNQEVLTANFSYREQWLRISGTPSTQYFCAHAPLKNPNVALGVVLEHDADGGINETGIYMNYAYRLELGMNRLAFGLKFGLSNRSQDKSIRVDPDPLWSDENVNFTLPNFGFGVSYYGRNYWAGFSIPRLFGFDTKATEKYKMALDISEYFISGGGVYNLNADFSIDPSLILLLGSTYRSSLGINAMATYRRSYSAGLGWRFRNDFSDAFILIASYCLNRQFSISYSYDMETGGLSNSETGGSHEINIYYKFGYKVNADNPRNF